MSNHYGGLIFSVHCANSLLLLFAMATYGNLVQIFWMRWTSYLINDGRDVKDCKDGVYIVHCICVQKLSTHKTTCAHVRCTSDLAKQETWQNTVYFNVFVSCTDIWIKCSVVMFGKIERRSVWKNRTMSVSRECSVTCCCSASPQGFPVNSSL